MQTLMQHPDLEPCGQLHIPAMAARCTDTRRPSAVTRVQYDEVYFYRHRLGVKISNEVGDEYVGQVLSSVIVWYDHNGNLVGDDWQITSNLLPEYLRVNNEINRHTDPLRATVTVS